MEGVTELLDVGGLLELAQERLDAFPPQVEVAGGIFQFLIQHHGENVQVLEAAADFLLHHQPERHAEAQRMLEVAVVKSPEVGGSKYLKLAQLAEGKVAVDRYLEAVRVLKKELTELVVAADNGGNRRTAEEERKFELERRAIVRQISSAHCSIAELYMTDLCDEEDAETQCANFIANAIGDDHRNFEAHSVSSTYYKVLGQLDEAQESALKALGVLKDINQVRLSDVLHSLSSEAAAADDACESAQREKEFAAAEWEMPTVEARLNLARTMIDLMMLEEAQEVLSGVVEEDEESAAACHLLAILSLKNGDLDEAEEHLKLADEHREEDDEDFLHLVEHLRGELSRRRQERVGPPPTSPG